MEGAQKLVSIDHVNVVMGDILSAVTAAVASSVTIPNRVVEFTGGTAPALPELNPKGAPLLLYQLPASNNLEGVVLAQVHRRRAPGKTAAINVAADNNLGNGLAANFKTAWTAGGGTIPEYVLYNENQPTLDTAAQQLSAGVADGMAVYRFLHQPSQTSLDPLQRTGHWDPTKTFGSGTLADCKSQGQMTIPGMRAVRADVSAGKALPQYQAYYEQTATGGGAFQGWTAESFDSVIESFLAALEAKSADPSQFAQYIGPLTNPPGTEFSFVQLDKAIDAILRGRKVHYAGVSGPLNFLSNGASGATAFQIFQVQADGTSRVVKEVTITVRPAP